MIKNSLQFDLLDNWVKSLYMTVQSEYNLFCIDNTKKATSLLNRANELEIATGANTIYTDIAIDTINGKDATVNIISICKDFYNYPFFLFTCLFSLSRLFRKYDRDFPDVKEIISFGSGFSKKILSTFLKKTRVLIIYSWWDAKGKEDKENKLWVSILNIALRKHGINCFIDKTCSLDKTENSTNIIFSKQYDAFVVVLTSGFKKRIEKKKGVVFVEYCELLNLLNTDADRVILITRNENDIVSPKELRLITKYDLSTANLKNINDCKLLGLVRRIMRIPYYDNSLPLIDTDIEPENFKYIKPKAEKGV